MHRRLTTVPALALGVILLSGCAAGESDGGLVGSEPESPAAEPTPATTFPGTPVATAPAPVPSPTGTARPWPDSRVAPDCEDVATLDWLHENYDPEIDGPDEDYYEFTPESLPGPAARRAAAESSFLGSCTWGIPGSDGAFTVTFLDIQSDVQASLISALDSSPEYIERTDGYVTSDGEPAPTYVHEFQEGIGTAVAYAFHDRYWVSASGTMLSTDNIVEMSAKALAAAAAGD